MSWKILDFKPIGKNTLEAKFNLEASPMIIKGFTYHKKGDSRWINPPATAYTDGKGDTKYNPVCWFPEKQRFEAFQKWCLEEIDKLSPAAVDSVVDESPF
jgi:hypothetical protein